MTDCPRRSLPRRFLTRRSRAVALALRMGSLALLAVAVAIATAPSHDGPIEAFVPADAQAAVRVSGPLRPDLPAARWILRAAGSVFRAPDAGDVAGDVLPPPLDSARTAVLAVSERGLVAAVRLPPARAALSRLTVPSWDGDEAAGGTSFGRAGAWFVVRVRDVVVAATDDSLLLDAVRGGTGRGAALASAAGAALLARPAVSGRVDLWCDGGLADDWAPVLLDHGPFEGLLDVLPLDTARSVGATLDVSERGASVAWTVEFPDGVPPETAVWAAACADGAPQSDDATANLLAPCASGDGVLVAHLDGDALQRRLVPEEPPPPAVPSSGSLRRAVRRHLLAQGAGQNAEFESLVDSETAHWAERRATGAAFAASALRRERLALLAEIACAEARVGVADRSVRLAIDARLR